MIRSEHEQPNTSMNADHNNTVSTFTPATITIPTSLQAYRNTSCYEFDSTMNSRSATAYANVNIALIKYWGKRDEHIVLPYTSSLSLTLADWGTTTSVTFNDTLNEDDIRLNDEHLTGVRYQRIVAMLDLIRAQASISSRATVISHNTVPTAAGLASSASGFAALACAAQAAAGLRLDERELSCLARRGSGSASRSIFPNLALWHAGDDDTSSYAQALSSTMRLSMIAIVLNASTKPVSSRQAMRTTVATSPSYIPWVRQSATDLQQALEAIDALDIWKLGEVVERNALGMHQTMHDAHPSINYLTDESHTIIKLIQQLRHDGLPMWATMDAGPNIKVLTTYDDAESLALILKKHLSTILPHSSATLMVVRPGQGARIRCNPLT